MWAVECHTEEVAARLGMDPIEFRRKNLMPVGYTDPFSKMNFIAIPLINVLKRYGGN